MTARAPFGSTVEATAMASTTLHRTSELILTISTTLGDGDGETGTSPGDMVKYVIGITNDGTVTQTDITVSDTLLAIADNRQVRQSCYCLTI